MYSCVCFSLGSSKICLEVAELDKVARAAALRGVDIEETRLVGHALGLLQVVRDDGDGEPLLEFQHQLFDFPRGDRVQGRARLVHQQHRRLRGDGSGDAEPLLLASGEGQGRLVELVLHLVPESRPAKGLFDLLRLVALEAVEPQAEGDVAIDAHRERVRLLEDHADVAADRHRVNGRVVDVLAVEVHVPLEAETAHQVVHAVQTAEHRALAAARWANEGRDAVAGSGCGCRGRP